MPTLTLTDVPGSYPKGSIRGVAFEALYKSTTVAALNDPTRYDYLALIDAIRLGRARERNVALGKLKTLLLENG